MSAKPFVLKPEDRERDLNVIGARVTVLATGPNIQDLHITEQAGAEGVGPPPHRHDWDESFYVIKGQVEFNCGGEVTTCPAGTLVHVPAGNVHAFSFGPGGGELLEITGRRSKAVGMFTAVDREIPTGPPDVHKVVEVLGSHGVEVQQ